jgi:hypothetical protein
MILSFRQLAALGECRVLGVLATEGAMSIDDLVAYPTLRDLSHYWIALALLCLQANGRITRRRKLAHYRPGNRFLQRDAVVFAVKRGGQ